jgi:hypothetical protein
MDAVKALKTAIVAQWLLIVTSASISIFEEQYLPNVLKQYVDAEFERSLSTFEIGLYAISILILFVMLHTSIAIYRLKPWAKKPYTFIVIIGAMIYLFIGPQIMTPVGSMLDYISTLSIGFTLGLLYFSKVSTKFERNL